LSYGKKNENVKIGVCAYGNPAQEGVLDFKGLVLGGIWGHFAIQQLQCKIDGIRVILRMWGKMRKRNPKISGELVRCGGWDSVFSIATRYGLDGPGIECRWERDFPNPSRPALGPTQPPVKLVRVVFAWSKATGTWR
jgi:hypothetical protein